MSTCKLTVPYTVSCRWQLTWLMYAPTQLRSWHLGAEPLTFFPHSDSSLQPLLVSVSSLLTFSSRAAAASLFPEPFLLYKEFKEACRQETCQTTFDSQWRDCTTCFVAGTPSTSYRQTLGLSQRQARCLRCGLLSGLQDNLQWLGLAYGSAPVESLNLPVFWGLSYFSKISQMEVQGKKCQGKNTLGLTWSQARDQGQEKQKYQSLNMKSHQSLGLLQTQDLKFQLSPGNLHPEKLHPTKPYISLSPAQFLPSSHPSRGSHLVSIPINLLCEVVQCNFVVFPGSQQPGHLSPQSYNISIGKLFLLEL